MRDQVIVDTGPIVAFINGRDRYHDWAKRQWAEIHPPLLTCESVVSEACFLVRSFAGGETVILELLQRDILQIPFRLSECVGEITWLLKKYADIPMLLADACLVWMAESHKGSSVFTIDRDFTVYRKNKRNRIPVILPPDFE